MKCTATSVISMTWNGRRERSRLLDRRPPGRVPALGGATGGVAATRLSQPRDSRTLLRGASLRSVCSPEHADRTGGDDGSAVVETRFQVAVLPHDTPNLLARLEGLRAAAQAVSEPFDERAQERIRGEGANFFVSTEAVLDLALSFAAWALLADHYGRPLVDRFTFMLDEARSVTAAKLDGRVLGDDDVLSFKADGRNTLFPLVAGFGVLADLCDEASEKAADLVRDKRQRPFYAGETSLAAFPSPIPLPFLISRRSRSPPWWTNSERS